MNKESNLYFCGLMGAGKTTIGQLVADSLQRDFVDLDLYLEEKHSKDIPTLFSELGESGFRGLESTALKEVSGAKNRVISLGGGSLITVANRQLIKKDSLIYLWASAKTLASRLEDDTSRPLLNECKSLVELEQRLENLLAQREHYEDNDLKINTENKTTEQIVAEVLAWANNESTES